MKQLSLFMLMILALGCSQSLNQSNSDTSIIQPENGHWHAGEVTIEDALVSIVFTNKSDGSLMLFDPMEKLVEIQVDNEWKPVPVLYCDCDAPCPAPPTEKQVEPGSTFKFSWDLMMEECKDEGEAKRSTLRTKMSTGSYRVTYYYQTPGERGRKKVQAYFNLD